MIQDESEFVSGELEGEVLWLLESGEKTVIRCRGDASFGQVMVYLPVSFQDCVLRPGDRVHFTGSFFLFEDADNPGVFDVREYYANLGYYLAMSADSAEVLSESRDFVRKTAFEITKGLSRSIDTFAEESDRGTFKGILLGNTRDTDESLKEDSMLLGLSYLISSSGFFVSLIGMTVYRLLRNKTGKESIAIILSLSLAALYTLICGFSASSVRALLILFVRVFASKMGRVFDLLSAAAFALILMLLERPTLLNLPAVQFYLAVIIGSGVIAPSVQGFLFYKKRYFTVFLYAVSMQISLLPMAVLSRYGYSLYTLPSGFILSSVRIFLWVLVLLGGGSGAVAGGFSQIPKFFFGAGHYVLEGEKGLITLLSKLPGAFILTGKPDTWRLIVYGAVVFGMILVYRLLFRMQKKRSEENEYKITNRDYLFSGAALAMTLVFGMFFLHAEPVQKGGAEITALSVGQGDCFLVRTDSGESLLIDCGSSTEKAILEETVLPALRYFGIKKVDAVVLSHADNDHISGILSLFSKTGSSGSGALLTDTLKTSALQPSAGSVFKDTVFLLSGNEAAQEAFLEAGLLTDEDSINVESDSAGSPAVLFVNAGEELSLSETTSLLVLSPDDFPYSDDNDLSLTFLLRFGGHSALFTGDISASTEEKLVQNGIGHADYLKVSHHGSKYASSEDFLAAVSPEIAVISVGKRNSYGHPHRETLARLKDCGAALFSTSESGAVTVRFYANGKVKIETGKR